MLEEEKNREDEYSSDGTPKKRKRVRVGDSSSTARERVPYRSSDGNKSPRTEDREQRPYQPRSGGNTSSGGYQQRREYGSGQQREGGGYNQQRRDYNSGQREGGYQQGGYQQRRDYGSGQQREGGYNQQRRDYGSNQGEGGQRSDYRPRNPYQQQGPRRNEGGGGYQRRNDGRSNEYQQRGRNYNNFNSNKRNDAPARYIKPLKYKENVDPETEIRLNKYLANAGVCSRREADGFITSGEVKVNGEVMTELGTKIKYGDKVQFKDKDVEIESKVYVLLNKPKNCVTTSDDPQNRLTVMDLVKNACSERIYPVGRLDRNTTGVLLLTNDGDLASKLMHPKFKKKKIYQVTLDKDVTVEHMQAIADGIELDDGEIHADSIAYNSEDKLNVVGIEIHSGRNRVVRRIFEKLGYRVVKLDRVYFSGLTKKNVTRGKWRYLSADEVNMLRMGAFE